MSKKPLWWEILFVFAWGIGLLVSDVRRLSRRIEWHFLRRHIAGKPRILDLMLYLCFREFRKHEVVNGASYSLLFGPGRCEITNRLVCWETPLGIAIWSKDRPMIAMGVEIRGEMLCIRQLQGVPETQLPREMSDWPRRFVHAAQRFARLAGLKGVRLYRAHTSAFYWNPTFAVPDSANPKEQLETHRQRMDRRYDGTARQMGFRMKRNWGEWLCPTRAPNS